MSAAPPPRAKPRNRRWTVPEVAALATEVRNVGEQKGKWKLIAQVVSTKGDGRSSHDCLLRWTQVDDPKIKKGAWTDEETDRLHEAVDLYGKNWVEVAKHVGSGRTPHSCQRRLKSRPAQLKWTDEELFLLHGLVGNSDQVDWQKVRASAYARAQLAVAAAAAAVTAAAAALAPPLLLLLEALQIRLAVAAAAAGALLLTRFLVSRWPTT